MVSLLQLTCLALALAALGEFLHARRVRRVAYLAFGPRARPAHWARAAPTLRVLSAGLLSFGFLVLLHNEPAPAEPDPESEPAQHLLVSLDVSPSMWLADAGPRGDQRRSERAADLVETLLVRLDRATTRVTVVAFYSSSMPVVVEGWDMEVVSNVLRGLPLSHAFEVGQTRLQDGVRGALAFARAWPRGTATLLVLSDGDAVAEEPLGEIPPSIADALVVGVGNPYRGSAIAGRSSRQDEAALKHLAARLGGSYHDGNEKHIPTSVVASLRMGAPEGVQAATLVDLARVALGLGAALLALLPLALAWAGGAGSRGARSPRGRRVETQGQTVLGRQVQDTERATRPQGALGT